MRYSQALWIGVVGIALLVTLFPLLRNGFFLSDDGEWMIIRLSAFYQSLAEGQFPVRFLGRLNHSYGYPVANFLYPGFLYIGSVLHLVGLSFTNSIKLIIGGSIIGSSVLIYTMLRQKGSYMASAVGAVTFATAPYLLFDVYKRGSVGEILCIFATMIGMYSIKTNKLLLFPLAIAGIVLAHNSLAVLILSLFIAYLLYRKLFTYAPLGLLGLGLASFFWIPAIAERGYVKFDSVMVSDPTKYFLTGEYAFLVGLSFVVASVLVVALWRRVRSRTAKFFCVIFFLSILLSLPISKSIWQVTTWARLFQFPFRMISLTILTGPWLVAATIDAVPHKKYQLALLFIVLSAVSAWPYLSAVQYVNRPEGYYTTNEGTTTVADEYMPAWVRSVTRERNSNKIEIFLGKGTIVPKTITTQKVDTQLVLNEDSIIALNTVFYPGWGVLLDDQPVAIDYGNEQGLMRFPATKGTHRLVAEFRETPLRFIADILSLGSAAIYILMIGRHAIARRRSI